MRENGNGIGVIIVSEKEKTKFKKFFDDALNHPDVTDGVMEGIISLQKKRKNIVIYQLKAKYFKDDISFENFLYELSEKMRNLDFGLVLGKYDGHEHFWCDYPDKRTLIGRIMDNKKKDRKWVSQKVIKRD